MESSEAVERPEPVGQADLTIYLDRPAPQERLLQSVPGWQQFSGWLLSTLEHANAEIQSLQLELATQGAIQRRLRTEAATDRLTQLQNRGYLEEVYRTAVYNPGRRQTDKSIIYSLVLLDLDKFKQINDTHGHTVGDEVLKETAQILQSHGHREGDIAARYGGEEFALLLIDTDENAAYAIAEELRSEVQAKGPTTISGGVVLIDPTKSFVENVNRADKALYAAKNGGRNQILKASELAATPSSKNGVTHWLPRRIGATIVAAYSAWSEYQR